LNLVPGAPGYVTADAFQELQPLLPDRDAALELNERAGFENRLPRRNGDFWVEQISRQMR
jgi:hypothetical protein